MSPAVLGRPERRPTKRAASRPSRTSISLIAVLLAAAASGAAHPGLASELRSGVNDLLSPPRAGFDNAVRDGEPTATATAPLPADVRGVLDTTNAERARRGLPPLELHPQLMIAAQIHAADSASRGCTRLSHVGTDGSSPFDRIGRTGYRYRTAAENIACGLRTAQLTMTAWMNSAGHRSNILGASYTHVGIAVDVDSNGRLFWVQVFASPR